jgi:hypothetical protein
MEALNFNKILNREEKASAIKEILTNFELNKNNLLFKKGIYVYGDPGSGNTRNPPLLQKDAFQLVQKSGKSDQCGHVGSSAHVTHPL